MRFPGRAVGVAAIGLAMLAGPALAATGDLDKSFGRDGIVTIDWGASYDLPGGMALQADDGILVSGTWSANGGNRPALTRLRANGDPDGGFGSAGTAILSPPGSNEAEGVAIQADGKIVVVGSDNTDGRALVLRTDSGGQLDSGFSVGGVRTLEYGGADVANAVAVQSDGKILVAGHGGSLASGTLTRLGLDSLPDAGFGNAGTAVVELGANEVINAVALQPDGKVVVGGTTYGTGGMNKGFVARFTAGGTPDTTFDGDGVAVLDASLGTGVNALALQPDGKIDFAAFGTLLRVGRLNAGGSPDKSFDDDGSAAVDFGGSSSAGSLAVQADGKIVVGGSFSSNGFGSDAAVARLQPNGLPDATFHGTGKTTVPAIEAVRSLALQRDGDIVLFGNVGYLAYSTAIARLQGDTAPAGGGGVGGGGGGPGGSGGGGTGGGPTSKVPRCAGRKATIVGTRRSDRLKGTRRADVIVALGGNDRVDGGRGNDLICAGDGNDSIKGSTGNDRLYGQNGKDRIAGGTGNDKLDGGSGNDRLSGDDGKDGLAGGKGNDALDGGSGKDRLAGNDGKDKLKGGSGSDSCNGGGGRDSAACEHRRSV